MAKFWRKGKVAITGTLLFALGIGGFVALGYYYSNSDVGTEYVGVGAQVDSLNYNTGTGNMYRITTPMNEGLLTPTTDFKTLQAKITVKLTETTEYYDIDHEKPITYTDGIQTMGGKDNLTSLAEYELAAEAVLKDFADDYLLGDKSVLFETLNENEKALVILASSGQENLETAAGILTHARPVTYIGDNPEEAGQIEEWVTISTETDASGVPLPVTSITAYAYGVADAIYTNGTLDSFRFRLKDGTYSDNVSTWEEWIDDSGEERNDRVSAADVAFGISRQIPSKYASSNRYMYDTISGLIGASEANEIDAATASEDASRYNHNAKTEELEAIYNGIAGDTTQISRWIDQDEKFDEFKPGEETKRETGVVFYDPKGYEDSKVEVEDEYSYVDFNLELGQDTFPTTMAATAFWPVNWEWFNVVLGEGKDYDSDTDRMNLFATSEKYTLSNGAQRVTKFDNIYGYDTVKNENYYDAEYVTAESTSYRMIPEASTQVAMFVNGDATYITGADSNSKVIMDDYDAKKWLKEKFTKPATKYMFFNLGSDRWNKSEEVATHAQYTSDPNFRRAFGYAFNTNVYHQFNSTDTAAAVSTFEPMGMYTDGSGTDFVNYMTDTNFTNKGIVELSLEDEQLEYFTTEDRTQLVSEPLDFNDETLIDPTQNYELADYYFELFLEDMEKLGVELPKDKVFHLKYLTSVGGNDPFIKTIQQTVNTHEFPGGYYIKVEGFDIYQVSSAEFWPAYYGADYDLASIQWGPDYLDSWSNIGIFNASEISRGSNASGGWNMWDGSDYTFNDDSYSDPDLARELFNDGFKQVEETNKNITSVEYAADSNDYGILEEDASSSSKYLGDSVLPSGYTPSDFNTLALELLKRAKNDGGYDPTGLTGDLSIANTDNSYDAGEVGEDGKPVMTSAPRKGINYNANTKDIWSDPALKMAGNLLFEIVVKDSASVVIGTTESGSISPSRGLLEGDPVVGYEARTFAFDLTKANSFWKEVKKELYDEFYIN